MVDEDTAGWVLQRTLEPIIECFVPVPMIDVPALQIVDQLVATLSHLDMAIADQVIEVPNVSCHSRCARTLLRTPQTAEQLVKVPRSFAFSSRPLTLVVDLEVPNVFFEDRVLPLLPIRSWTFQLQVVVLWVDTEAIEPEDLEPRRIELDRNLGTDPNQIQQSFVRNSVTEDVDEFGKVGAETSCLQSQMHSDYDSAESSADSYLEDGGLRKMLASPLYLQSREECEFSRSHRGNLLHCYRKVEQVHSALKLI